MLRYAEKAIAWGEIKKMSFAEEKLEQAVINLFKTEGSEHHYEK